jgi:hypothetical protein
MKKRNDDKNEKCRKRKRKSRSKSLMEKMTKRNRIKITNREIKNEKWQQN